ncbi:MAG: hypothetical protein H0U59_12125 [Gemmatimonadaceae bacterium]|nr:hypothetical protein [Gemmatimonadaceae bacterium]
MPRAVLLVVLMLLTASHAQAETKRQLRRRMDRSPWYVFRHVSDHPVQVLLPRPSLRPLPFDWFLCRYRPDQKSAKLYFCLGTPAELLEPMQ